MGGGTEQPEEHPNPYPNPDPDPDPDPNPDNPNPTLTRCANLAALYQMTDGAATSKQGLERLVVDYAPDDFDIAALTPLA